jgi:hypothetical protein
MNGNFVTSETRRRESHSDRGVQANDHRLSATAHCSVG